MSKEAFPEKLRSASADFLGQRRSNDGARFNRILRVVSPSRSEKNAEVRTASVLGLGYSLPETIVRNEEIAKHLGIDDEWIVRRMGVRTRRWAAPTERLTDLAADAGRYALRDAGISPNEVDLVLVATLTADQVTPNAAPLVAHTIGAHQAGAMDVGAACVGWLSALALACGQIEAGRADNVLVIGADMLSRVTNHDDKSTAPLFGDGAGAVVVGPNKAGSVGPIVLANDGRMANAITCEWDERKVHMDGHETFKAAVKVLTESTEQVCEQAGCSLEDVDLFVYHQANGRILQAVAEKLELPQEKVVDYIAETANTSSASVPLSLALARDDGRLHAGDRVLLGSVGAGFVWGSAIIEWGGR